MKKKLFIPIVMGLLLGFGLLPFSCARDPKFYLPKVGQKYSFLPVQMNNTVPVRYVHEDLSGLHLTVRWGGRAVEKDNGNPTLKFYKKDQDTPFYSAAWSDLETAYKTSGCNNEQIESLDGPMPGVALICDGRIKMSEVAKIEAISDKGEVKFGQSFSTYKRSDDVLAAIVQLY
jgi:hypothetical protein